MSRERRPTTLAPKGLFHTVQVAGAAGPMPVVVFMHGIRDDGSWVHGVSQQWRQATIIELVSVGNIGPGDFASREKHDGFVAMALDQLLTIQAKYPGHPISVVCHSYGTELLLHCLDQLEKFDAIVLMACLCKQEAGKRFAAKAQRVINYCGVRDIWPLVATARNRDIHGCTGIFGFRQSVYANDIVLDYGHSSFTSADHLNNLVFPAILYDQYPERVRPDKQVPLSWERFANRGSVAFVLIVFWFSFYSHYVRAKNWLRSRRRRYP